MRTVAAVLVALAFACGLAAPVLAQAPDYPNGKITFIVGFAPGAASTPLHGCSRRGSPSS
jgi:tripartite-type tricarboxylate transporter receptor subunit TctC